MPGAWGIQTRLFCRLLIDGKKCTLIKLLSAFRGHSGFDIAATRPSALARFAVVVGQINTNKERGRRFWNDSMSWCQHWRWRQRPSDRSKDHCYINCTGPGHSKQFALGSVNLPHAFAVCDWGSRNFFFSHLVIPYRHIKNKDKVFVASSC